MPSKKIELSGVERMLLAMFYTVPIAVRAEIGQRLFDAWVNDPDRAVIEQRRVEAWQRFKIGPLGVNVMDDLRAGGPAAKQV